MSAVDGFVARVDAAGHRLSAAAGSGGSAGLTSPDARTGERWDAGQAWAHVVELVPYWIGQVRAVLAAPEDGAAFGRTVSDPGRIEAIERDRRRSGAEIALALDRNDADLRAFLRDLSAADLRRAGTHPTLGRMSVEEIVDRFLVAHLEEHAAQIEELGSRG
ncbi:MAG TPA: DinB family protein [Candidatus Dormibacteraeota bacterium]|nr:DinB family protein [Candidatus Dormibacteraeota bacterium]